MNCSFYGSHETVNLMNVTPLESELMHVQNCEAIDEILELDDSKQPSQRCLDQSIFETMFPGNGRPLPNIDISSFIVDPEPRNQGADCISCKPAQKSICSAVRDRTIPALELDEQQFTEKFLLNSNVLMGGHDDVAYLNKMASFPTPPELQQKEHCSTGEDTNELSGAERQLTNYNQGNHQKNAFHSDADELLAQIYSNLNENDKIDFEQCLTDEQLLLLRPKKKRKKAKFESPVPSRFCHVCSRTPKNVRLAVCSKIRDGTCRKVICERCFDEYKYGNFDESALCTSWICPHCSGMCPERAQCRTYSRINDRLRVSRLKQPKRLARRKRQVSPAQHTLKLKSPEAPIPLDMTEDIQSVDEQAAMNLASVETQECNVHTVSNHPERDRDIEATPESTAPNPLTWDHLLDAVAPPVDPLGDGVSLSPISAESYFENI